MTGIKLRWRWLKTAGLGTIIFFTIKGVISTALILLGGSYLLKGC